MVHLAINTMQSIALSLLERARLIQRGDISFRPSISEVKINPKQRGARKVPTELLAYAIGARIITNREGRPVHGEFVRARVIGYGNQTISPGCIRVKFDGCKFPRTVEAKHWDIYE